MGAASRQKGKRIERFVVDTFKAMGFNACRVPFSGAGREKGDVKVEIPGTRRSEAAFDASYWYYEVKARFSEFDKLTYFVRDLLGTEYNKLHVTHAKKKCNVSFDPMVIKPLNSLNKVEAKTLELHLDKEYLAVNSPLKKLFTYQKWIQGCECLVLKGNRLPLVYIDYETTFEPNNPGTQVSNNPTEPR